MRVTTTQELDLTPLKTEFELSFAWTKKRGSNNDFWFTPSGKCKIWFGCISTSIVGNVSSEVYHELITQLKANKTDVFVWGNDYYTTTGNNISRLHNMGVLLRSILVEWEGRKYIEFWVEDDRSLTEV